MAAMTGDDIATVRLTRFLAGGAISGLLSAVLNGLYFAMFRSATDYQGLQPSLASIAVSSLFPSVLASLGYFVLTRFVRRPTPIFIGTTLLITAGSFAGLPPASMPDGSAVPAGFLAAIVPMHLIVGGLAALVIPWFASRRRVFVCETAA
jgi:hypothetical protein